MALPLEVLRLTGSSLDLALIVSARTIPAVVLLLVGGTRNVPADMLGRASSVDWALSLALAPLGTIAAGAAAGLAGIRATLIAGGVVAAATGALLLSPAVTAMTGSVSLVPPRDARQELSEGALSRQACLSWSAEAHRGRGPGR